jgi:type II secretion system (T2SS) protein G
MDAPPRSAGRAGLATWVWVAGAALWSACGDPERVPDRLFAEASESIAAGNYADGVAGMRRILDEFPESRAAGTVRDDWLYYEELLAIEAERLPVRAAEDMRILGRALEAYRMRVGRYPANLEALLPHELDDVPVDPWGRAYLYHLASRTYVVQTLGRDGAEGGTGEDRDMRLANGVLHNAPRVRPPREAPTP